MVFLTIHYKQATGLTGLHIKARTVDTCNYIVILNVVGAVGIATVCLSGISLILNSGHFPTKGRIVVVIVCVNMDIASGNITCCDVVYHLLTISTCCIVDLLGNTGSKLNAAGREVGEVGVLVVCNVITCKITYMVCKCIANCTSESDKVLSAAKISCTLKGCDKLVRKILCVNSVSNLCACTVSAKSIGHEVRSTILISQILRHIVHEDLGNTINIIGSVKCAFIVIFNTILNRLESVHDVICIKVAIIVFLAEAGIARLIYGVKEVLFTDNSDHLVERTAKLASLHLKSCNLKKVYKVACPTGNVSMIRAEVVVIGNIHCAEDVTNVRLLAVRKSKVLKILKACYCKIVIIGDLSIDLILHLGNIRCKVSILVTRHNTPRTGIVSLNTGTDILDNKSCGILGGIKLNILVSHFLKENKVVNKVVVIIDCSYAKCRNYNLIGRSTALLASLVCLITVLGTSGSLCGNLSPRMILRKNFLRYKNFITYRALLTFGKTCVITVCLNAGKYYLGVTECCNMICNIVITTNRTCVSCITALSTCRSSHNCIIRVTERLAKLSATNATVTCSSTCCSLGKAMSGCKNYFLCNENLITYGTVLAFCLTIGSTGCGNSNVNHFGMTKCRNNLLRNESLATSTTVLAFCLTIGSTGRSYSRVNNFFVTKRLSKLYVTNSTVTSLIACRTLGKAMSGCINNSLRNDNLITYGAMLTLGKTGLGTSSSNRCVNHLGMSEFIN